MGPTILFDKSFLQQLSKNEARWVDCFFFTNICPVFYIETLADLSKETAHNRSPIQIVKELAGKTPIFNAHPCLFHEDLYFSNLLGNPVSMNGQIPIMAEVYNIDGNLYGYSQNDPTSEAFERWRQGDFLSVEKNFAKSWRVNLSINSLDTIVTELKSLGVKLANYKNLEQINIFVKNIVDDQRYPELRLNLLLSILNINSLKRDQIIDRWQMLNGPTYNEFAPYASYVLSINLYFNLAILSGLISSKRPSHRIDLSYLYYLPFCMIFTSHDRFHRDHAKYFLRQNQEFVWGSNLKQALKEFDTYYQTLSSDEKNKGLLECSKSLSKFPNNLLLSLQNEFMIHETKELSIIEKEALFKNALEKFETLKRIKKENRLFDS